MAAKFFHCTCTALKEPVDVRQFLADPEKHWKEGRSAMELATSWMSANDIPARVRSVLDSCDIYGGAVLLQGLFEQQTDLRSSGHPSQTDLLVLLRLASGRLGVIAVEGKAAEAFDQYIRDWNDSVGKQRRLDVLCSALELDSRSAEGLRYQLLHRTAAALFEAERYGAQHAMVLVHSFSTDDESFKDYSIFAKALGLAEPGLGRMTSARTFAGVELRLAWVADRPAADSH